MSGRRHHFVPQFIQRKFANERGMVCVYHQDKKNFQVKPDKIGLQRDFYESEAGNADTLITTDEEKFYVSVFDSLGDENELNARDIAVLIAHLTVRTKSIRESAVDMTTDALSNLSARFTDHETLLRLVRTHLRKNKRKFLREHYSKDYKNMGISKTKFIEATFREISNNRNELNGMVNSLFSQFSSEIMHAKLKDSIISRLMKESSPEPRVKVLSKLNYRVYKFDTESLVLSDSIVIYKCKSGEFKIVPDSNENLASVYLTLSPKLLLVGSITEEVPDPLEIRKMAIRCSSQFFISKYKEDDLEDRSSEIGQNTDILSNEKIDKIIEDVINTMA